MTARDLLSNQLPGLHAAGLAASTSVSLSASGPRASSLIPTPFGRHPPLSLSRFRRSVAPSPRARCALRTPSYVDTRRKRRRQRYHTLASLTAASEEEGDKESDTKLERHQGWGSSQSPWLFSFRRGSCPAGYVTKRGGGKVDRDISESEGWNSNKELYSFETKLKVYEKIRQKFIFL